MMPLRRRHQSPCPEETDLRCSVQHTLRLKWEGNVSLGLTKQSMGRRTRDEGTVKNLKPIVDLHQSLAMTCQEKNANRPRSGVSVHVGWKLQTQQWVPR